MSRSDLGRRCLQLALILCLVGIALTFLAIWGQRQAAADAAWRDPIDDVRPEAVAPDLTLLSLAGIPDSQVLALAIESGELETMRALLATSPSLTDQQRVNGWLWLAHQYQKAGQTRRAAQAFRLVGDGAVLSAHLPDLTRVETLLTVGQQLISLHDKSSARHYLRQAALIGAHAPHLTDHARRSLLERLIPISLLAGGQREDWHALDKAVEEKVQGQDLTYNWHKVLPGQDAALVNAQNARRSAAGHLRAMSGDYGQPETKTLASRLVEVGARLALRRALEAEDEATQVLLEKRQDLAAQETRLRWLLLKRRVAAGGVVVGLMPAWASDREQIDVALASAWADWLALYTNAGSVNQSQAAQASRQALMAAYWGLYPQAPVAELVRTAMGPGNAGRLRLTIIDAADAESGTLPIVGWSER